MIVCHRLDIFRFASLLALLILSMNASTPASTIYVDSRTGDDQFNGYSRTATGLKGGPVATMQRGLSLLKPGDRLEFINNGTPYYGSLSLYGTEDSGTDVTPLQIIGNGSTISGARPIPRDAWQEVRGDVYRITPIRKGHYQLVLDGNAVPQTLQNWDIDEMPMPANGECIVWRGAIYYSPPAASPIGVLSLMLASSETGLSLINVRNVIVKDVIFEHFRVDGVHLHSRCEGIMLDNVTCRQNGRAGFVINGSSQALLKGSTTIENRGPALMVHELAEAEQQNVTLDGETVIIPLSNPTHDDR